MQEGLTPRIWSITIRTFVNTAYGGNTTEINVKS